MAESPLFCNNIGNTTNQLNCCYASNQSSQTCRENFNNPDIDTFTGGCLNGDCLKVCSNVSTIYQSLTQIDPYQGNGQGPIRRYLTCANVPAMAGYLSQDVLGQDISSSIGNHVSPNASDDALKNVTLAVTKCLTTTCTYARNKGRCQNSCSSVNMLINSTTPDIQGVNECLYSLCKGGYNSLPFADADIVGIGVFASYIMQCMFVVILWFGLSGFQVYNHRRRKKPAPSPPSERMTDRPKPNPSKEDPNSDSSSGIATHQGLFENFIVQFHNAQCYFSATLQIAALSYDIFETNMLITFMLTPLATNGVLPVVFNYVLLFRCGKSDAGVTLLTVTCWLLSSIVYWILYASIIPINQDIKSDIKRYRAYQQFMYKLSALDECGGYSALAVCPDNFILGKDDIFKASHNLRVLTPIIWGFSTVVLLATLAGKLAKWTRSWKYEKTEQSEMEGGEEHKSARTRPSNDHPPFLRSRLGASLTYWLVTVCFLAGIGMQLSLLSIGTSLHMMDRMDWSFGQIVAVTIWTPPLLGYLYDELGEILGSKFHVCTFPS